MTTLASKELTEAILNKDSSSVKGLFEKVIYAKIHSQLEEKKAEITSSIFGEEKEQDDESEEGDSDPDMEDGADDDEDEELSD